MAKEKESSGGGLIVIIIIIALAVHFTRRGGSGADPVIEPAYPLWNFPKDGSVVASYWFPGLFVSYRTQDNSYLPVCGLSNIIADAYYPSSYSSFSSYPISYYDFSSWTFGNSPECTAAMINFNSTEYKNTATQLFDVSGAPIKESEVVKGRNSCLCFAMYDQYWNFSTPLIFDHCILIGEDLDVQSRESVTIGLWQADKVRNKTTGSGVIANCTIPTAAATTAVRETRSPVATPTHVVDILQTISPSLTVPDCANPIQTDCVVLYDNIKLGCLRNKSTRNVNCLCSSFQMQNSTCQNVCQSKTEATSWLHYISDLCPSLGPTATTFDVPNNTNSWIDFPYYHGITYEAYLALLPWRWNVTYSIDLARSLRSGKLDEQKADGKLSDADYEKALEPPRCPTRIEKLGVFVIINVVTFVASLTLGRRDVVHFLTCKMCGSPKGNPLWPLLGTLFASLSIAANIINAYIVKSTPGFGAVPLGELFLLWCSRPRITWIGALFILIQKEKAVYFGIATTALITELLLQIIGGVYIFRTVNFARQQGYYPVGALKDFDGAKAAWMMYAGGLLWAIFVGLVIGVIIWSFFGVGELTRRGFRWLISRSKHLTSWWNQEGWLSSKLKRLKWWKKKETAVTAQANLPGIVLVEQPPAYYPHYAGNHNDEIVREQPRPHSHNMRASKNETTIEEEAEAQTTDWEEVLSRMGLTTKDASRIQTIIFYMALPFIGQWLFWVGYVDLYGDLYCPPKLGYLTAVWVSMSVFGVFVGGTV